MDYPSLNNKPDAFLSTTQQLCPGSSGAAYNPHESGVMYDAQVGKWAIFNVDGAPIPAGAAFNVQITNASESVFVHHTIYDNTAANATYLAHPLLDGKPQALLLVTQSGTSGRLDPHEIGVAFDSKAGRWTIFNQDLGAMPIGVDFQVEILGQGEAALVHRATRANTAGYISYIDEQPGAVGPQAIVFVTQNWNPDGQGGIGNPHAIGVWYDAKVGRWAIFNQDLAPMPLGAAFNVSIVLP